MHKTEQDEKKIHFLLLDLRQIFTFPPGDEADSLSLFFQEMKHDVSLSHEGGDLSLGLLKKEKTALPCNEVSPENSLKT